MAHSLHMIRVELLRSKHQNRQFANTFQPMTYPIFRDKW